MMQKNYIACGSAFSITEDDLKFYETIAPVFNNKKYLIPPPTHCPNCRQQRRLAFTNIRNLYQRPCSHSNENVISIYSADKKTPVYKTSFWWSDQWDPFDYGKDIDFNVSLLQQITELFLSVPVMALVVDGNENSEYVNYSGWDKNCHLCFCTDHSEDCMYCQDLLNSNNILDSVHCYDLELCYECIDCNNCYNLRFSQNCAECVDSGYLYDCRGCSNCFGCVGLRQKKHHFFNEQLSAAEYKEKVQMFFYKKGQMEELEKLKLQYPRKPIVGSHNENSSGNYIFHCKNAHYCFDCKGMQDSKFCQNMKGGGKNCHDITRWGNPTEFCYECCGVGEGATNVLFSFYCWGGISNLYYCHMCITCHDCFGCSGLRHKQYCIFNRQYSKEEYEGLIPKIIEHMQKIGEWGEFFPAQDSPFAYNETVAQEYFPLTKEQVEKRNWQWKEREGSDFLGVSKKIPAEKLPPNIADIPDDILNWAIECSESKRLFKIQKAELEFYRKVNLPIPHLHPDVRHQKRMALRNPRQLWTRNCQKCNKEIQTTYSPERPEQVYCESCYLSVIH